MWVGTREPKFGFSKTSGSHKASQTDFPLSVSVEVLEGTERVKTNVFRKFFFIIPASSFVARRSSLFGYCFSHTSTGQVLLFHSSSVYTVSSALQMMTRLLLSLCACVHVDGQTWEYNRSFVRNAAKAYRSVEQ